MPDTKLSALTQVSIPDPLDLVYGVDVSDTTDGAGGSSRGYLLARTLGLLNSICDGRLTLTSGLAVTTADVAAAASIYFTPYGGQCVSLYDGTRWRLYTFTELTLALGTLTSGLPYDVFLYDNSGTLTLELLAWTNGTTRATALVLQNGVYCKTGALTRRYLGTFYTTSTTTTECSVAKSYVYNLYNQSPRICEITDSTSHTYGTNTVRQWRATAANQLNFVLGLAQDIMPAVFCDMTTGNGAYVIGGFALDATNVEDVACGIGGITVPEIFGACSRVRHVTPGYHFVAATERATATSTFDVVKLSAIIWN